jgi:hypothetical protein
MVDTGADVTLLSHKDAASLDALGLRSRLSQDSVMWFNDRWKMSCKLINSEAGFRVGEEILLFDWVMRVPLDDTSDEISILGWDILSQFDEISINVASQALTLHVDRPSRLPNARFVAREPVHARLSLHQDPGGLHSPAFASRMPNKADVRPRIHPA